MRTLTCLLLLILLTGWGTASASDEMYIIPDDNPESKRINLPYAFYNENFGVAAAYIYSVFGYPQKQSTLLATAMVGTKGSAMGFFMGHDIQMPWMERLFTDPVVSVGYFSNNNAYINGNPSYIGQRAGSNQSDRNNYVTGSGMDTFARLKFKFLLPMGHGQDQVISEYRQSRGMLESGATGATSLNPFASGRTFLELRPFYRSQQIDGDYISSTNRTNGIDLSLFWDNRDFPVNPAAGNSLRVRFSRDFGILGSSSSWSNVEGEADQYFSLGGSDWFRQRVIALDIWTACSPTWQAGPTGAISNRPPAYTGATLGGLFKMRGYPAQRFSDKSAVYYSAEFRMIPDWNPFDGWDSLQKHLGVQWIQLVPFAELGRVAPEWRLNQLHTDMKWDLGLSLRAMAKGLVLRLDVAGSNTDTRVQMMVGHPFQF